MEGSRVRLHHTQVWYAGVFSAIQTLQILYQHSKLGFMSLSQPLPSPQKTCSASFSLFLTNVFKGRKPTFFFRYFCSGADPDCRAHRLAWPQVAFLGRVFGPKGWGVFGSNISRGEKPGLVRPDIAHQPSNWKKCKIYRNMLYNPLDHPPKKTHEKWGNFWQKIYGGFPMDVHDTEPQNCRVFNVTPNGEQDCNCIFV